MYPYPTISLNTKWLLTKWINHLPVNGWNTKLFHITRLLQCICLTSIPQCATIYIIYIYIQFNADETPHWILAKSHNISLQLPTTNKRKWCDAIQQPRENRVYFSTIDFEVVLIYGWPYIIHEKKTTCSKHCPTKGKTVFEIARWELKAVYPTRWAWKTTYQ